MKKYYVLIGNYGSGKTELALNFAFNAAAKGLRTELLDLDMVNTYFRLTERGKMARMKEIRLVSPNYDAVGSTALGRYHQDFMELEESELEVLNVVNIRRPLAGTVEKIIHLQEEMQIHSRLKITGMINNTNLAQCTTPAELRDGYEMIREVSEKTGVPVLYTSGKKAMLDSFLAEGHDPKYIGTPLEIDTYMQRDWDSWVHGLNANPFGVGEK